ncbi:hypothetical protein Hdeb2414_s0018g00535371 [Helianthus debilis subsp. tardiflorus]
MTSFLIGSYDNRIVCLFVGLLRDQDHDDHICGLSLNLFANFCIFNVFFFSIVKYLNLAYLLIGLEYSLFAWTFVFVCCRIYALSLMESEQEHHISLCYSF